MIIKKLHLADEDVVTVVSDSVDETIQHLTGEITEAINIKPTLIKVVGLIIAAVKEKYPELQWFIIGRNGKWRLDLHTKAVRMDDIFDLCLDIAAQYPYLTVVPLKLMPELKAVGESHA